MAFAVERDIGAVLVPELRVDGTIRSPSEIQPSPEYLRRFPPAGVVAFGRTPAECASRKLHREQLLHSEPSSDEGSADE